MSAESGGTPGWTIDELAHRTGVPSRTLREYQRLGLLAPPDRRGRVGVYGGEHERRLGLIGRLQARGYSLAGIRDLLDAWSSGETLDDVLGDPGLDEQAQAYTRQQLVDRAPWLAADETFHAAVDAGLVRPGADRWYVRAPSLLALVDEAVAAGSSPSSVLTAAGAIREAARCQADALAAVFVDELWGTLPTAELERFGRRARVLSARAAAAMVVDELGSAIQTAASRTGDRALAAFVESMALRSAASTPPSAEDRP